MLENTLVIILLLDIFLLGVLTGAILLRQRVVRISEQIAIETLVKVLREKDDE